MRLYDVVSFMKEGVVKHHHAVSEGLIVVPAVTQEATLDEPTIQVNAPIDVWQHEIESVFQAVHQAESTLGASEFCIEFDKVAEWIGFSRKDHAKTALEKNCEKDVDFLISLQTGKTPDSFSPNELKGTIINKCGRPSERILITADCFKTLAMIARTEQGRRVRKFYLELEKRLRNGDLTLAGEVVKNYDAKNGTTTNVLLNTQSNALPRWVPEWRDARTDQMDRGKTLREALHDMDLHDGAIYSIVENMHNQGVLGFDCTTTQWRKEHGLAKGKALAEVMDKTQLELRRMMAIKLLELYSTVENPTSAQIRRLTQSVKEKIADMSVYMNCNCYKPESDDKGNEVPIGKRVRELEVKHRRTQKRLKTIEAKQALIEANAGPSEIAIDKNQRTIQGP